MIRFLWLEVNVVFGVSTLEATLGDIAAMELPILARCVVLDDGESVVAGDGVERSATHALILETEFSKLLEEKGKKKKESERVISINMYP